MPLRADFQVGVGDNGGDIQLRQVDVAFEDSRLDAVGEVVRAKEVSGRRIAVDVQAGQARAEDLIRLVKRTEEPPLTGDIELETKLVISAGEGSVLDRMRVKGDFAIERAEFSNMDVQKTLARVSRVTSGDVEGESGESVVSNLEGEFELQNAVIRFFRLSFGIPGTRVALVGNYELKSERLDFRGLMLLSRAPSEMAPGWASRWLEGIDPLFHRDDAGFSLPITIRGSRSKPVFRPDLDRVGSDWAEKLRKLIRPQ